MSLPTILTLEVATPKGLVLRTEAQAVRAPSVQGEFGVFPGHVPFLAALRSGLLHYRLEGTTRVAAIGPGFAETEPDSVQILTDLFALPEDIDVEAARRERAEAEEHLKKYDGSSTDARYGELRRTVAWAQARIDAVTDGAH